LSGKRVFLAAGDVGAAWSLPLFFDKDAEHPIYYLATGLGDTEGDAVLLVTVSKDGGEIDLSALSLTGFGKLSSQGFVRLRPYGLKGWLWHFRDRKAKKAPSSGAMEAVE
ncbi:hypothetical protein ACFL2T_05645, partial [Elusimicrobiota bacterium]